MYKSLLIAKKILEIATKEKKVFTPMQLIKLVYLSHGWLLGLYNRPLIEEDVEAWKYGPVISELYYEIKHYKGRPVEGINCEDSEIDRNTKNVIQEVYEKYGNLSGIELSMVTHETNSPWEITWNDGRTIISNDLIADYYKKLANNE